MLYFDSKQQLANRHVVVLEQGDGLGTGRQDVRDLHFRLGLMLCTAGLLVALVPAASCTSFV